MSWSLFHDQTHNLYGSHASGDTVITLEGLTGNQLLIQAANPSPSPTWRLGLRLLFVQPLPDFPGGAIVAESYGRKVLLAKPCLIEAPLSIDSPYAIKLLIPYWHKQLNIKIHQRQKVWS
jgi:hypothetical protein